VGASPFALAAFSDCAVLTVASQTVFRMPSIDAGAASFGIA